MADRGESERLFYLAAGPLAAIVIGMLLTPLRGLTPASNFTFAFMSLIIVVSELGGRGAALGTALISVLSLDFFLTQPYMRLQMEDKHDIVAFVGLAVCGLIAAALGSQRAARLARLKAERQHLELVMSVMREWESTLPAEPQLRRILQECTLALPLAAAVVRDLDGGEVAASGSLEGQRPIPSGILVPDALASPVPGQGGRVALLAGRRPIGWLDVWGNGRPMSLESRRALADLARLLALFMAGLPRGRPRPVIQ